MSLPKVATSLDSAERGRRLRAVRTALSLNGTQFGELLGGLGKAKISRWESGVAERVDPMLDRVFSLIPKMVDPLRAPEFEQLGILIDRMSPFLMLPRFGGDSIKEREEVFSAVIRGVFDSGLPSAAFDERLLSLVWPLSNAPFRHSEIIAEHLQRRQSAGGAEYCPGVSHPPSQVAITTDRRVHGPEYVTAVRLLVQRSSVDDETGELLQLAADTIIKSFYGSIGAEAPGGDSVAAMNHIAAIAGQLGTEDALNLSRVRLLFSVAQKWQQQVAYLRDLAGARKVMEYFADIDGRFREERARPGCENLPFIKDEEVPTK